MEKPLITISHKGILKDDGVLIEAIVHRKDGDSAYIKILTAEDPEMELTEDEIVD